MKRLALIALLAAACAPQEQASAINTGGSLSERLDRGCAFAPGGWATVDCSDSAAAVSSALNTWTRYVAQCGDDSYVAWGGSTVAADSSDGWVTAEAWVEFVTHEQNNYFSCLNINIDSDCRIIECR